MKNELHAAEEIGAGDLIGRLGNISLGALNLKDYETFELGVRELQECASISCDSGDSRYLVVKEMRRLIMRTVDDQFASETLGDAIFESGVESIFVDPSDSAAEILNEVAEALKSVDITSLRQVDRKIMLIGNCAGVAIDRGERSVVSRLLLILHVIGDRLISEMPSEVDAPQRVVGTLGDIMLRVMDEGRLLRDPASLVRSGILRVEDLGTKGLSSNMEDVREWAVRQLRRVADHTSEVAKQVEGNARASMAVLGN